MTEIATIASIICVAVLLSAAINTTLETTRLKVRRAQMQAEIDHACQPVDWQKTLAEKKSRRFFKNTVE